MWLAGRNWQLLSPGGEKVATFKEKPLKKYEYKRLKERGGVPSRIVLERIINKNETFTSYLFSFTSEGRKITGLANIPLNHSCLQNGLQPVIASTSGSGQASRQVDNCKLPVIVQFRGYVDPENYQTGVGTRPSGEVYAANNFITLAPDYLGYGESDDPPSSDVWEERFLRIVNGMDLLASINSLPQADPNRVGIWGHSNGGLASLTMLALTGKAYPVTLWAPVSIYFPYDVLYYTWEADDRGKSLRQVLAEFEKDYDAELYSFDNYMDGINKKTVVQLHQGTGDAYIPMNWSENIIKRLKGLGIEANLYTYPGADHNLRSVWNEVVARDLEFFKKNL